MSSVTERLAVCSWSLQPQNPQQLVEQLEKIGIRRVQIGLDPIRGEAATWGSFGALAKERGIKIASGMFGTIGEDYTTMETIRSALEHRSASEAVDSTPAFSARFCVTGLRSRS